MKQIKLGLFAIVAVFALGVLLSSFFSVDEGEMVVYQNPLTKTVKAYTQLGTHLAMPLMSKNETYQKVAAVVFSDKKNQTGSIVEEPIPVRFADNYRAYIVATGRFALPTTPKELIAINSEFQTYGALAENLMAKTTREAMNLAASQFTSEDVLQGGLPKFREAVLDILNNGIPVLKKERRVIESNMVDTAKKSTEIQYVELYVPQVDKNGEVLRAGAAAFGKYGVVVLELNVERVVPTKELEERLKEIRDIFDERKGIRAKQENARQSRITAKLEGETKTEEAEQKAKLERAVAVENAKKLVELAQQDKNKVLVNKTKQLEVARAEKEIQKAKAEAAILEAKAIRSKGLAEADVIAAKLKARNNPVALAEIQRDMAIEVSKNMAAIKIQMPNVVMGNSGGGTPNSMSTIQDLLSTQMALSMQPSRPRK